MLIVSFAAWVINRATTHLVNPPDFKIWSLIQLTVPPAVAGTPPFIITPPYYYPPSLPTSTSPLTYPFTTLYHYLSTPLSPRY